MSTIIPILTLSGKRSTISFSSLETITFNMIRNKLCECLQEERQQDINSMDIIIVHRGRKITEENKNEIYQDGNIVYYLRRTTNNPPPQQRKSGITGKQLEQLQMKTGVSNTTMTTSKAPSPQSTNENSYSLSSENIMQVLRDDPFQLINILSLLVIKDPYLIGKIAHQPDDVISDLKLLLQEKKIGLRVRNLTPQLMAQVSEKIDDIPTLENEPSEHEETSSHTDTLSSLTSPNETEHLSYGDISSSFSELSRTPSQRFRVRVSPSDESPTVLYQENTNQTQYNKDYRVVSSILSDFELPNDMYDMIKSLYLLFERDEQKTRNYVTFNHLAQQSPTSS